MHHIKPQTADSTFLRPPYQYRVALSLFAFDIVKQMSTSCANFLPHLIPWSFSTAVTFTTRNKIKKKFIYNSLFHGALHFYNPTTTGRRTSYPRTRLLLSLNVKEITDVTSIILRRYVKSNFQFSFCLSWGAGKYDGSKIGRGRSFRFLMSNNNNSMIYYQDDNNNSFVHKTALN